MWWNLSPVRLTDFLTIGLLTWNILSYGKMWAKHYYPWLFQPILAQKEIKQQGIAETDSNPLYGSKYDYKFWEKYFIFEKYPLPFSILIRVNSLGSPAKTLNFYLHVTVTMCHFLKNLFSVGCGLSVVAFTGCTQTERDCERF